VRHAYARAIRDFRETHRVVVTVAGRELFNASIAEAHSVGALLSAQSKPGETRIAFGFLLT
jgi:hypothetical protein